MSSPHFLFSTSAPLTPESECGQRLPSWRAAASLAKQRLAKAFKKFPWPETGGFFRLPSPQPGKSSRSCNLFSPQPTLTILSLVLAVVTLYQFSLPQLAYGQRGILPVRRFCNKSNDDLKVGFSEYPPQESLERTIDMALAGRLLPKYWNGWYTIKHNSCRDFNRKRVGNYRLFVFAVQGDIKFESITKNDIAFAVGRTKNFRIEIDRFSVLRDVALGDVEHQVSPWWTPKDPFKPETLLVFKNAHFIPYYRKDGWKRRCLINFLHGGLIYDHCTKWSR